MTDGIFGRGRGSAARTVAAGAAAGFGLEAGRDAYGLLRRWWRPLAVGAVALGVAWAAFDLVRGHGRGRPVALAARVVADLAAAAASVAALVAAFGPEVAAAPLVGLAVGGASLGALVRPGRLRRFAVEARNARFLSEAGFVALGGSRGTLRDPAGDEVVPFDARPDALVFEVLGRPGVLTRIPLDGRGVMLRYEGAPRRVRSTVVEAVEGGRELAVELVEHDREGEERHRGEGEVARGREVGRRHGGLPD